MIAPFQPITLAGCSSWSPSPPLLWVLTRRLPGRGERERLLRCGHASATPSGRRIARDLHDGVVQDLAGTAFALSALAGAGDPGHARRPARPGAGLRAACGHCGRCWSRSTRPT